MCIVFFYKSILAIGTFLGPFLYTYSPNAQGRMCEPEYWENIEKNLHDHFVDAGGCLGF